MKIEEYNSVKKWFTKGVHGHPYSHKTVKPFVGDVQVTDDIIRYKGTSWLLKRIRKRDNFTLTSYRRGKIR